MRFRLVLPVLVLALTPLAADAKLSAGSASSVQFNAVGPGGMKITGTASNDVSVADDGQALTVTVPLADLATGIALRDKHMKEKYLEVSKFPQAALKVARASLKTPSGDASGDAQGTLTLHGVSKPVGFHYTATRGGKGYRVAGAMKVNMNDFGIEVPKYLGVTVKPEVDVAVSFDANEI